MPRVIIKLFRDERGRSPVMDWLADAGKRSRKVTELAFAHVQELRDYGHELRRPAAAPLRDGIYELRLRYGSVQYRLLYFFSGRDAVVISHGLSKEDTIPTREIELAIKRRALYLSDPERYTFTLEED